MTDVDRSFPARVAFRAPGRTAWMAIAATAALALLLDAVAGLVRSANAAAPVAPPAVAPTVLPASAPSGPRFTLRLGQGFAFGDHAVVDKQDPRCDVAFRYLPPQVGGMALRYNPVSQQVEQGLEPTLTTPVPLLVAVHVKAFDGLPDLATTTSGDVASWFDSAPIAATTRSALVEARGGEHFLLVLDELEALPGKYDDWRIGFRWQKVEPPPGPAGGVANRRLPGRLVFRDWCRTKMIVAVDLGNGREVALADGTVPTMAGESLLGFGDTTGAYVVRDATGAVRATARFDEEVWAPVLSPDGTVFAASVRRPGPPEVLGGVTLPTASVLSVAVFDLAGQERLSVRGYDEPAWTPDGRLIATGALTAPGLVEIDPATGVARAIDARIAAPSQCCVSPDGRTIAFVTGDRVWLIGRDGGDLRQLLPHGTRQQRPVFSPDGSMVAMVVCNQLGNDLTGEVVAVDLATREVTTLRTSTGLSLLPDTTTRLSWVR